MHRPDIARTDRLLFYLQYGLGRMAVVFLGPLIWLAVRAAGYRIRDLATVRKTVRDLTAEHAGPWLVCANHLTLIDSVVLAHAMFPWFRYVADFRRLPWNVPEKMNFSRNLLVRLLCYLTKCIPVTRGGDRDAVRSSLDKCMFLLKRGESLMIFPEGTRSRSGRVNTVDFSYGPGRLLRSIPGCRVMAVYLRGDGQNTWSGFPRFGEIFTMTVEECRPETRMNGIRAQKDCAAQIVNHLSKMESEYFDARGK
jgi:1-acyl-sn-glycerol-3-phosphate acyltransferase